MYGGPKDWFGSHGWHVEGVEDGENWEEYTSAYYRLLITSAEENIPKIIYSKNRKGRGYFVHDAKSHGVPHSRNSELFWKTKEIFASKYNVEFEKFGNKPAETWDGQVDQAKSMFRSVFSIMDKNKEFVDYLSSTLINLGDSVPEELESCKISKTNPVDDSQIFNLDSLPDKIFEKPGVKIKFNDSFSSNFSDSFKLKRPFSKAFSLIILINSNI